MNFPEKFIWGAAAASYQVEGGAFDDEKGLSVWDAFCHTPGKIWEGHTGDVACDHYHRYVEDVQLMREIGLKAYRLSISWPRVIPQGTGAINPKGLAFYDRLIDTLLENNIQPWVTLFHWDYPYSLYCRGGWLNRDSADWFANYAAIMVDRLSDRVSHWMTQNEPQAYLGCGHQTGEHAPGSRLGFADLLRAVHHSLLSHGKAVQVIRSLAKTPPQIGCAIVGNITIPETDRQTDIDAARRLTFSIREKTCFNNTWFADPMILGKYPEDGLKLFEKDLPEIRDGDMETICQPLDFYAVNIYFGYHIRSRPENRDSDPGLPLTTMEWEVMPDVLYWGPKFLYERYRLPIVITENGMSNCDWVHADDQVHDPQRIDYLKRYLRAYKRAIDDGVEGRGYFAWSIMDNFEWAHGYKRRFGLIYVNFATLKRTLKDSAFWYQKVIQSHGRSLFSD